MNMNKKLLKETQPVVYKTLSNALTKDHWHTHIYLKEIRVLLKKKWLYCLHKAWYVNTKMKMVLPVRNVMHVNELSMEKLLIINGSMVQRIESRK